MCVMQRCFPLTSADDTKLHWCGPLYPAPPPLVCAWQRGLLLFFNQFVEFVILLQPICSGYERPAGIVHVG